MRSISLLSLLLSGTVLAGCSLAPDFTLPETPTPQAYKEQLPDTPGDTIKAGQWKAAEAMEAADRGRWWTIFGDERLNALEDEAQAANQSLKASLARLERSRALAESNTPSFLPDLDIGGNAVRAKPPGAALAAFGTPTAPQLKPYNLYSANGVLSYEADLFGSVRDNYRAFLFDSEVEAASYRSMLLALQADVAQYYFSLRALDAERRLMRETVDIRAEAARIMQRRFDVGSASEVDTTRTRSELAGVKAELLALDAQRRQLENALAVLLGKMPSEYRFEETPLEGVPPLVPADLPSNLLERRPDIAGAIAAMQAANKRIGVARTAFFPNLTLTASGGYQSTDLGDLFDWSSRTWALGQTSGAGALVMSIFDSGRNFSRLDASKSAYAEAVANYRQQVLVAFRDVEDSLTAQRLLAEQFQQQEEAAHAAGRTTYLVGKRYDQGDVDYFQVVDAQRVSLTAQRAAVQLQGQRYLATVGLVRALGGGWEASTQADTTGMTGGAQDEPASIGDAAAAAPVAADTAEPTPQLPASPEDVPVQDAPEIVPEPQALDRVEDTSRPGFFEEAFGGASGAAVETDADASDMPAARLLPPEAEVARPEPEEAAPEPQAVMPEDGPQEDATDDAGIFGFDLGIEMSPPGEKIAPVSKGTQLETRPLAQDTGTQAQPVSLDMDWDIDLDIIPADEALKASSARDPLQGTVLETAPVK